MNRMKSLFLIIIVFILGFTSRAQTNEPVKLAIVAESPEASAACDILTAQLSANSNVHLLERDDIDKVYHEQGMSAENRDDVKLGRLLGADGLLLLRVEVLMETNSVFGPQPTDTNVTARLIAVKPGVIVMAGTYSVSDPIGWSSGFAQTLNSHLSKLAVPATSAIPISIINLRSSIQTPAEEMAEKEVKQLAIERLSQEQRLFVLERERMQQLGEEKVLNSEESAFWNGSFLLDGTIDQNGYSPDIITVSARLTPPKGGVPLSFELSDSRTNLAGLVNQLADKVTSLLNVKATAPTWNAADEAKQYFDDAAWALRWKSYPEAEASAGSAWALGKQDLDCAQLRVMSCLDPLPEVVPPNIGLGIPYVHINDPPDITDCDAAINALEYYCEFCRASTNGQPKMVYHNPDAILKQPDWYFLGVDTLVSASEVLQHYYFNPQSQPAAAEKLAELRSLARSVAAVIAQSPSVHDSYYVGDRVISSDMLSQTFSPALDYGLSSQKLPKQIPNFFDCMLQWGPYWQERPEDEIALYRELMTSPLFFCIHGDLWSRKLYLPRLVAWNEEDKERLPVAWSSFINELDSSTNYFLRFEGKALACADARTQAWAGKNPDVVGNDLLADNDSGWKASREALLDFISTNYASIVGDNGNLPCNGWGMGYLLGNRTEYGSRFIAIQKDYINHATFEEQIKYLTSLTPFDWDAFNKQFAFKDYSKAEAAELLPLITAYRSNMLAQASSPMDKMKVKINADRIDSYVIDPALKILNSLKPLSPPSPFTMAPVAAVGHNNPGQVQRITAPPAPNGTLHIHTFLKIPYEQFLTNANAEVQTFAQRWSEGKLLIGLEYQQWYGDNASGHYVSLASIAIFDPTNESWFFVNCTEPSDSGTRVRMVEGDSWRFLLFQGNLYSCLDGLLEEYDFKKQLWHTLNVPEINRAELFEVNNQLYAANDDTIFEVGGNGTIRILASTRRNPPETSLDSLDDFQSIQLFTGPGQSLCASIGNKIYRQSGNDWQLILTVNASWSPDIFDDVVIFREFNALGRTKSAKLWLWKKEQSSPVLCLDDEPGTSVSPLWHPPLDDNFINATVAYYDSNLFLFSKPTVANNGHFQPGPAKQYGFDIELSCLSPNVSMPIVLPLKFDTAQNQARPWRPGPNSQLFPSMAYIADGNLFLSQVNLPGIWVLPASDLESAINAQKQAVLQKQVAKEQITIQNEAVMEQNQKEFLAKYDLNQNGVIDPDEKEAALQDQAYIETELDAIDVNHNGILDPEELAFFDANSNKILDPNERTGIFLAQTALADRDSKEFDANGDGFLDIIEFTKFLSASEAGRLPFQNDQFFKYRDNARGMDANGLEGFLKHQTLMELRSKILPGPIGFISSDPNSGQYVLLKAMIDAYWQNPHTPGTAGQTRAISQ